VQFFFVFPPICAIIWLTLTHKTCFFFNGHLLPEHLVTGAGHVSADLTENPIQSFQNVTAVSRNDWLSFDTKQRASRESRHTTFRMKSVTFVPKAHHYWLDNYRAALLNQLVSYLQQTTTADVTKQFLAHSKPGHHFNVLPGHFSLENNTTISTCCMSLNKSLT
jgi:hypothetical protein